jgi:prolyl 4-hydroxylase
MAGSAPESPHFRRAVALVEGRSVARDLAAARAALADAVDDGDAGAVHVLASLLAGGFGGPRDWPAAIALLRDHAAHDGFARAQLALIDAMALGADGEPAPVPAPQRLHHDKQIELLPGLLAPAECDFLVRLMTPRLQPATVLAAPDQASNRPAVRDADHAAIRPLEEPVAVRAINARIAAATGTQIGQGEPLQIMRYRPGQQYRPHVDGVGGGANKRVLTAIAWLNDDYEGGETAFTELGLTVRGRKGDLLVWRNLLDDGALDRGMRHAGLPVTRGAKYIASRWILQRPPYDADGQLIGATLWSA